MEIRLPKKDYLKSFLSLSLYFAQSDMRARVAGSFGGVAWLVLQPLMLILLFIFLFSFVLKIKLNHAIVGTNSFALFMISGLLPWFAFQEGIMRAMLSIIENREVVKKIYIPLESIPCGYMLSVQIIYGVVFLLFSIFCLVKLVILYHIPFVFLIGKLTLLVLLYFMQFIFTAGLGLLISAFSVYIRDIIQIAPIFFQAWFYLSPIVYPEYMVPSRFKMLLSLNFYNSFLKLYRILLLKEDMPRFSLWITPIAFSLIFFILGYSMFNKLKENFVDVL